MTKKLLLLVLFISLVNFVSAQDTIRITGKQLNSDVLKEGKSRYLVYFRMGKDSPRVQTQFWTREIQRKDQNGKSVIIVNQEWEDKDTVMHVVHSVSDAKTMKPLYHKTWWRFTRLGTTVVDFTKNTVEHNGKMLSASDTMPIPKRIWKAFETLGSQYSLNWHLDMEIFPTLPYKDGVTFMLPFYDPGTSAPFEWVTYKVVGSAELTGYDQNPIPCWLMLHESKGNKELFWISKKTREVLKLEQEVNGSMYRYKIKLAFSS